MNKTQEQLHAESAWRKALMRFVGHKSDFNVNSIADKLTSVEFNREGEMIERGRSYAYLKRHTPSMFGLWRTAYMEVCNGEDETRIHRNTQPSKGDNRKDKKKSNGKTLRKNPRAKHRATVHPG